MSRQRGGIPIGEAAEVLGLNVDAVRKRIKRGTLDAYKQDERWYVVLPGVQPAPSSPLSSPPGRTAGSPVQDDGDSVTTSTADQRNNITLNPVTPAEIERAIEATATRYMADFAGLYDRISADVAARYEQTIAAKDETIAELRRRAEVAESALAAAEAERVAPASPAPRSVTVVTPAPESAPSAPAPAGGFWARVRRAIGGER